MSFGPHPGVQSSYAAEQHFVQQTMQPLLQPPDFAFEASQNTHGLERSESVDYRRQPGQHSLLEHDMGSYPRPSKQRKTMSALEAFFDDPSTVHRRQAQTGGPACLLLVALVRS